jgi:hypothetical protein
VICGPLWFAGFIDQMGSVDGSFIAFSRYMTRHMADLSWFPLWFCGMPFSRVYQPGLHVTVAALAIAGHMPVERAYRVATAFFYAAGPATLAWLCYRLTMSQCYGFCSGLIYSLTSPSAWMSSAIRNDLGGWTLARRFQTLAHYGEGPHIAALALIPVAIWCLHECMSNSRTRFVPLAAILTGAIVVTNWTGTAGLIMAILSYFVAQAGAVPWRGYLRGAAALVLGYLLIVPWLPPSVVSSFPRNAALSDPSQTSDATMGGVAGLAAATFVLHLVLHRYSVHRAVRFFAIFTLVSGFVVFGRMWGEISITPQPHRFHLETEMALIPAVLGAVWLAWSRIGRVTRAAAIGIMLTACAFQFGNYREYVERQTAPIQIEKSIEYRMAKVFHESAHGRRVFAPGSVSIWMNNFTGTPQMVGCCDQSLPSVEQRIAFYTIYSGANASGREAEIALLWLKAYGVSAIGVTGPRSKEYFHPFGHPAEFEGKLPVLWRDTEDNAVFQVPSRSTSLAHVILCGDAVARSPVHGNDIEPLQAYVRALDDPAFPAADLHWLDPHHARIQALLKPEHAISVQMTYDPGWRAFANALRIPVRSDALGLIIVEPQCEGDCVIDLEYAGDPAALWNRLCQFLAVGLVAALTATVRKPGASGHAHR